jgi:flagellar basal-body rod protein FlgB
MISKLDSNFSFIEASLKALSQRQEILSSNIANESTANFKAQDFDFKQAISDAVSASAQSNGVGGVTETLPTSLSYVYSRKNTAGLDGNNVNIDEERREMTKNALKYESAVTLAQIDIKNLLNVLQG